MINMTEKKIPKSVLQIVNLSIKNKLQPLTYREIAEALGVDNNAIVQRIKRNEEYFDINKSRPYKITLKKGIDEITMGPVDFYAVKSCLYGPFG